ncbi:MAG: SurA N-terminal domain-containing protein, partial [Aeromonadales bacterium]|nr:SurA N-terminal domain-containing protein [Aeromonadales bacterium]MDY2890046.1 SurA N-terminal domain-containing protein [Succinivibrio sp.]
MLSDTLREGAHGRIFKILFWIIILSFVFAGVGNYLIPRLDTDPVKVGDFKITSSQWTEQYNRQTQQIMRAYGPKASEMLEDKDTVKRLHMQVLESMVDNAALNAATWDQGIRIGDEEVKDVIRRTPAFQKDGKFDNDLFLASVHNIGASPESYAEQLRTGLLSDTVRNPTVTLSSQVMPYESKMLGKLFAQTRTADIYSLDPALLKDSVKVTGEEAKAYYDAHHGEFMDPANVRFTYVVLSVDGISKSLKISDKQAEDYYNMH